MGFQYQKLAYILKVLACDELRALVENTVSWHEDSRHWSWW